MNDTLKFLGAAGTVTGSKYLLSADRKLFLIDCGLFQGLKSLRLKNWTSPPFNPSELDCIVLTHAHIDHSGYIPKIIKEGFKGKIYCTAATLELCRILLPDSGHLMEEEAEYLNRHKKSKHDPALPLYTKKDAENALFQFEAIEFNSKRQISPKVNFEFKYAGHILGAASVLIEIAGKKVFFTGDVGRKEDRIFYPPEAIPNVDYLITESTYGNRLHKKSDSLDDLAEIVRETVESKGTLLIPSFAVGRAQSLMYDLYLLKKQNRIGDFPMYLNSPMGTNASKIFCKFNNLHKLSDTECVDTFNIVEHIRSVEESKDLNLKKGPMLIISASGMLTGGRILHHIKAFAPHPQNTILLTGFQASGTRGEALERGEKEIKIHGEYVKVNCKVKVLHNMSAHADYREILNWLSLSKIKPKKVYVTHGEPSASDELRRRITEELGLQCEVPEAFQSVELV